MLARLAVVSALLAAAIGTAGAQGSPTMTALSTDAHLVTGGDVLVQGVNQVQVTTWASFGPSPKHFIAAVTRP